MVSDSHTSNSRYFVNTPSKESKKRRISRLDKKYIESRVWECSLSPTGSHRWIIDAKGRTQYCIYCHETKETPKATGILSKQLSGEKYVVRSKAEFLGKEANFRERKE